MATANSTRAQAQLTDQQILTRARAILKKRLKQSKNLLSAPSAVRDYLQMSKAELPHEVFTVLFLNAQNRLIAHEEMFRGTLTQASVHPREVVKAALTHNAAAVILAHNHPSGCREPSKADEYLTATLKSALALVDVKVLDHFVVAGAGRPLSFAESGLL